MTGIFGSDYRRLSLMKGVRCLWGKNDFEDLVFRLYLEARTLSDRFEDPVFPIYTILYRM